MKKLFCCLTLVVLIFGGCKGNQGLTPEEQQKVSDLKSELTQIQADIDAIKLKDAEYAGGLIKPLFAVHIEQAEITKLLIKQQIAGIESGARPNIQVNKTTPNQELADQIKVEIDNLKQEIKAKEAEAAKYSGGLILLTLNSTVATHGLTLATLERNYLVAKYGLASPSTPESQGDVAAEVSDQAPDLPKTAETKAEPEESLNIDKYLPPDKWLPIEGGGDWRIQKEESLMGDAKNVRIALISPVEHRTGPYGNKSHAIMVVRCNFNKTELSVNLGTMVESDRYNTAIEYKIDDEPITKTQWNASTDWSAVFANQAIPFIKKITSAKKIAIRVETRSNGTVETYFNLEGLGEAIKPVQAACGWE